MAWRSSTTLIDQPVERIVWLAGLLEGEGSFGIKARPGGKSSKPSARVSIGMTDEDVIATVAMMFNRKYWPNNSESRPDHWSQMFETEVVGKAAEYVMLTVYPFMHSRRAEKIEQVLAQLQS